MQPFQNPPFCGSIESSAPAQEVQKHLECHLWGLIIVAMCVYLKMKSHVFCGKTFNLPLLPITHVSRLFAFLWLMALHVHRNIYFSSRNLDVSIFSRGVLDDHISGNNWRQHATLFGFICCWWIYRQYRTGQESQLIYEYA
jgi:hypothetical protein